ncbi:MAG: MMPL family transporter [Thermoanaerobaculia bacterium]
MSSERRPEGYIEGLSSFFERIGIWSYDHRWIVLAISVLVLAVCMVFASRVRFDNSFEAYFDQSDPVYAAYKQFREDFGSDELSYILYEAPDSPHGPWNLEVMRKIVRLTEALEDGIPFVKEVTSLANVEFMEGIPDGLKIYELLEEFPESQAGLLAIKDKVLKKPMYVGGLASADGRYAAIIIDMDRSTIDPVDQIRLDPEGGDGLDNLYPQVTYERIEEILSRPEYQGIRFHHAGDVPLNAIYNSIIQSESPRLGGICLLIIGGLLLFFFRRPIGVLGPLVVVSLSILVSIGVVGALGWSLDLMYIMLPVLLIAVGVADAVHIISEFGAQHALSGDRREAARRTMRLVGAPCLLTSLTTAAGFAAMSISSIKAISHFAIYSAVGVIAAFLLSVSLLMLFLSFGRRKPARELSAKELEQAKGGRVMHQALEAVCRFDIRYRKPILLAFGALFIFSGFGIARLRVDSNFLDELSDRVPIKRTTQFVDETMGGTGSLVYLFDTQVPDGIKDPSVLREIERLQREAERQTSLVMKTYSIVDVLKDINRSFHEGDPAYEVLPDTRELVAQYLLLYEISGGAEVDEYVSSDYSRANLELRVKLKETSFYQQLVEDLDSYLQDRPLRASSVSLTGMGALWLQLQNYITRSQIRGFLLAFGVIAVLMCLLFRSIKIGLIAMVPNLSPVILTLGVMGWLGIPLDYVRLLIGALAIGISVDDTIHHTMRYLHEFGRSGDYEGALFASMRDVGRALFITSAALILGFLVLVTSIMATLVSFGLLIAATVFVALVADFLLMPALVLTLEPFGLKREDARSAGRAGPST